MRRTLVEDAHVARHLAAPAEPGPLQRFHRYADDAGRETTQTETLDVSQWDAPATVCYDRLTDHLDIIVSRRLRHDIEHHTTTSNHSWYIRITRNI